MSRIKMPAEKGRGKGVVFSVAFDEFVKDATARGIAEKTLNT